MDNERRLATSRDGDGARQGVTGHNVRYVLGWGLLAAVLALVAVAIFARVETPHSQSATLSNALVAAPERTTYRAPAALHVAPTSCGREAYPACSFRPHRT